MASLNRVILMGNLCADPELRYTPKGTAVANLRLAVNRKYTVNGEKRDEVLFIGAVAWAKTAEVVKEYLKKGAPVLIEGRLQSRDWEDKQGGKRTTIEVMVENVQFLGSGKQDDGRTGQRDAGSGSATDRPEPDEVVPF